MKRIISMVTVVALVTTSMMAVSALSAPSDDVPPHQHYLITANSEVVRVGPNVCANPNAQQGFNNFHYNVHVDPDHPADIRPTGCGEPPPSP
jgi:hypothetical protein